MGAGLASADASSNQKSLLDLRDWASHFSAETRDASWVENGYVMPDEVSNLCRRLANE